MASAACSSTCIAGGELFCRPWAVRKETTSLKLRGGLHMVPICKEKYLEPEWMNLRLLGKSNCKGLCLQKQCRLLSKAVATIEPCCFIPTESGLINDSSLWFDSNSESQKESSDVCPDLAERERLRRMRISKANKGNIPWNKGRKHRPETVQKIRERTKLAMQDPKVKMKLVNLGHAQSDETKKKIAVGVRQGWERRRAVMMVQESCLLEWQNFIAESSRKGSSDEVELQWDSYKVMDEQLKQAWLESIEKRKSMPRPKGSKRAPKSLEQRRKISEAISAKWADPEYRGRVHAALSKYHGTTVGAERKVRRKSTSGTLPKKKVPIKKEPEQTAELNSELKNFKQLTHRKRKNSAPSYKDPMSSAKLELLKRIKAERAEIETKKKEATIRAKLLIAEAEKAAEALEAAAQRSPLAKASLLETRKLIAEATLSIQSVESGRLMPPGREMDPCFDDDSVGSKKRPHETLRNKQFVNGFHTLSSSGRVIEIDKHRLRYEIYGSETPPFLQSENEGIEPDSAETAAPDKSDSVSTNLHDSVIGAIITKKWVCGRFVELEDD